MKKTEPAAFRSCCCYFKNISFFPPSFLSFIYFYLSCVDGLRVANSQMDFQQVRVSHSIKSNFFSVIQICFLLFFFPFIIFLDQHNWRSACLFWWIIAWFDCLFPRYKSRWICIHIIRYLRDQLGLSKSRSTEQVRRPGSWHAAKSGWETRGKKIYKFQWLYALLIWLNWSVMNYGDIWPWIKTKKRRGECVRALARVYVWITNNGTENCCSFISAGESWWNRVVILISGRLLLLSDDDAFVVVAFFTTCRAWKWIGGGGAGRRCRRRPNPSKSYAVLLAHLAPRLSCYLLGNIDSHKITQDTIPISRTD